VKASSSFLILLFLWGGPVTAAPIPWSEENFSHFSDREDLRIVLRDLARDSGFVISVSDRVEGEVNGSFEANSYAQSFDVLARMFSLTTYFDGSVLWVSTIDEIESVTIQLKSISVQSFKKKLENIGILDSRWSWRSLTSERILYLTGPARYVEMISQMASKLDKPKKKMSGIVYSHVDENGTTMLSDKPFSRAKNLTSKTNSIRTTPK
jgi:type III secretion protein C